MQFVKERLSKWIQAAIILVVGILLIVAGAAYSGGDISTGNDSMDAISLVLGIILIIVGGLSLILAVVAGVLTKKGFGAIAFPGAILLAFGISMVVVKYAAVLIALLLAVVPYLLICVGAVVLGDAIFNLVLALKAKALKKALVGVIIGCVVGVVAIVLGALCIADVIQSGAQLIVLGVIVCLVAVFQVALTFVKLPDVVVVAVNKEEK